MSMSRKNISNKNTIDSKKKNTLLELSSESENNSEDESGIDSESDKEIKSNNKSNQKRTFIKSKNSDFDNKKALAKAINNMSGISKDFMSSIEAWKEITSDKIGQIINDIETKTNEYNELIVKKEKEYDEKEKILIEKYKSQDKELDEKYKNKEKELDEKYKTKKQEIHQQFKIEAKELEQQSKNSKIETEQQLKEFQINACNEIAIKNDYKLVSLNEYEKMQQELKNTKDKLEEFEKSFNDKLIEKIELEKIILHEKLKQDFVTKDLNHKAETAELIAQNKQQLKEIEFLNKLIANLTNEVSEQRNLTKEIAKASSKAQINQSFTKD
jgi:hypothetical protein